MVPSRGREDFLFAGLANQVEFWWPCHFPDAVKLDSLKAAGKAPNLGWRNGEEQLVVLPAVEGKVQHFAGRKPAGDRPPGTRNGALPDARSRAAGFAKMLEVCGKAVADVNRGGGDPLLREEAAEGAARLGVKMGLDRCQLFGGLSPPASPRLEQGQTQAR